MVYYLYGVCDIYVGETPLIWQAHCEPRACSKQVHHLRPLSGVFRFDSVMLQEVDVEMLLSDPKTALLPVLRKIPGWEQESG